MKIPDAFKTAVEIARGGKIPHADRILLIQKNRRAEQAKRKQAESDLMDMTVECASRGDRLRKAEESKALLASIHANTKPTAIKKASKSAFREVRREAKSGAKPPGGQKSGPDEIVRKALQKMWDLLDSGEVKSNREAAKLSAELTPSLNIKWGRLNNIFSNPEYQKKIGFVRKMQKRKR